MIILFAFLEYYVNINIIYIKILIFSINNGFLK